MELAQTATRAVSRPLHVLVPLIKDDLKQGEEASKRARMPYVIAAGEKMLEAREGSFKGKIPEFNSWLKRNFNLGREQARQYMKAAGAAEVADETSTRGLGKTHPLDFPSLNAWQGATGNPAHRNVTTRRDWHDPVKDAIQKVNVEALKQEALKRQEERALQRKLALSLIDIGYKALATKLHPDKGGSREAMARLNRVRDMLKSAVSS